MLWHATSLLALATAIHAASPPLTLSTCPRIEGPVGFCYVDTATPASKTTSVTSLVDGPGPTAVPTARYAGLSRRVSSAASPASTASAAATGAVGTNGTVLERITGASAVPTVITDPFETEVGAGDGSSTAKNYTAGEGSLEDVLTESGVQGGVTDKANGSTSGHVEVTGTNAPVPGYSNQTADHQQQTIVMVESTAVLDTPSATAANSSSGQERTTTTDVPLDSASSTSPEASQHSSQDIPATQLHSHHADPAPSHTPNTQPTHPTPTPSPSHISKNPSKHKYNYASPDCGARVQSSSPSSQHASGVLHKSRDRYMLTPCKADQHWVTIELCDEIRVEAVEVSVWEYFSGVVREVKVSIAGDEDGEGDVEGEMEMEEVGMFVGRNVRGAQTYTLQKPTSFSRFVRIDFPSYYGSEYYCPVSHIKVYGMNQLEAYKWEQKQVASSSTTAVVHSTASASTAHRPPNANDTRETPEMGELEKLVRAAARTARDHLPSAEELLNGQNVSASASATAPADSQKPRRDRSDSESIYAFITRRLADLEGNSTLILRYIDERTRILRRTQDDMYAWRRDQEINDAQRWESERMRLEDRLGRIFSQLEAQRSDRLILDAKLRVLEEQLSHERRRGFAQIAVLMMVIAIGAATRSDTIERLMKPILAEASRRKRRFTFSADLGMGKGMKRASSSPALALGEEWKDETVTQEEKEKEDAPRVEGISRSNSMGNKRANGGTPNSIRRRGHRPDHHHAPRSSLPARHTPRKLARTSHLHPMLGQAVVHSDATGRADGSPYAQSPLSPSDPQL